MTRQAVNYIVRHAGDKAKLGNVSPHLLRYFCGYYLADMGTALRTIQDYLATAIPSTRRIMPASLGTSLRGCGSR